MYQKITTLILVMALFSISAIQAATLTFTGGGDGTSWEDAANWDLGFVPGFNDRAFIDGTSNVTLSSFAAINSLRVRDDGVLNITTTAVLSINELDPMNDAIRLRENAVLNVNGSLVVLGSPRNGLDMDNQAALLNNGFVNIVVSNFANIQMNDNTSIVNNGTMFTQDGNSDGVDMENNAQFTNNGTLNILGADNEGLDMDNSSDFFNNGTLNISGAMGDDGIDMDDNNSTFTNDGVIAINNISGTGEGLEVDDGVFTNTSNGTVDISGVGGDVLKLESGGEVINDGSITIMATGNGSNNAVEITSSGYIENNNILNIYSTGSGDAIELESSSSDLFNSSCGVINILTNSKIDIQSGGGLFDNDGVLATLFTGTNTNNGTLANSGKIIAPASFMIAPNAVVGGGTITTQGSIPATSDCDLNIGATGCGGTTVFNAATNEYTQTANGCVYGPNYTSDQLSYAFRSMCGNGEIIARVASFTGSGWAGVAMRETTAAGSKKVQLMLNPPYALARREVRVSTNGIAFPQQFPSFGTTWVRIQRIGHSFRMYVSQNGFAWQYIGVSNVMMADCIEVGVVSTNYNVNASSTAVFDNVFITAAAPLAAEEEIGDDLHVEFENATDNESISVYPNPTSGKINIEVMSERDELVDIQVINALGQPVKSLSLNPTETFRAEVDLSGMPAGMYSVHFQKADGTTHVERVVLSTNE